MNAIINQIRALQLQGLKFGLELDSGRVIQIHDPFRVATTDGKENFVGVLGYDGVFELIETSHVVSVTAGWHPQDKEAFEKRKQRAIGIVKDELRDN